MLVFKLMLRLLFLIPHHQMWMQLQVPSPTSEDDLFYTFIYGTQAQNEVKLNSFDLLPILVLVLLTFLVPFKI